MFKRNGSNNIAFDFIGLVNMLISTLVITAAVLTVFYSTVSRIDITLENLDGRIIQNEKACLENKEDVATLRNKHDKLNEKVIGHIASDGK